MSVIKTFSWCLCVLVVVLHEVSSNAAAGAGPDSGFAFRFDVTRAEAGGGTIP